MSDPLNPLVRLSSLPPFPAAAARLIQLSASGDADLRAMQPVLASDPALAADVIRLANSPLFAIRNEVRSIEHAVVLLGLERIRALATAIALRRYYTGYGDTAAYRKCLEHSLACAVVSEELAESYSVSRADAYTAGLLHDIGRVGLLKAYAREYLPVLKTNYQRVDENLKLERTLLTMDHCQSGSFLTKVWAFPKALQSITENHHAVHDPNGSTLISLIQASCRLADALGFAEVNYYRDTGIGGASKMLRGPIVEQFSARASFLEKRAREKIAYFAAA